MATYWGAQREDFRRFSDDDDPEDSGLVSGVARGLTTALKIGRGTVGLAVGHATAGAHRLVGGLRDVGDDLGSYIDPGLWLEDFYALLGIASTGSVAELDERVDEMSVKVEEIARTRAREELFLLQQRISELETLIVNVGNAQTRDAVGKLLGRLSELESRIDALPLPGDPDYTVERPSL